jgi:hypothetical protein
MMLHLFVVSGSGQPAGFTIGWAPTFSGTPALAELPMPMRLRAVRGAVPVATHHPTRRTAECHRYIFTPHSMQGAGRASAAGRLAGGGSFLLRALQGRVCEIVKLSKSGWRQGRAGCVRLMWLKVHIVFIAVNTKCANFLMCQI